MADEREGHEGSTRRVATEDVEQSIGRKENDAQPLNSAPDNAGPERYPAVRQDDAVERTGRTEEVTSESRSFDPSSTAGSERDEMTPIMPSNAGKVGPDGKPAEGSRQAGFEGPQGDPAEGKR
jgi:hypothetical protein